MRSVELTQQGRYLHLVQFDSALGSARATIVIAPALGVKQRFYQPFAKWLSEQGFRVITFDYYGIGQSVDKPLKDINTDIFDWAELDLNTVLEYVQQQADGNIIYLAHSLGGQIAALAEQTRCVDAMVFVASGTGYWRHASSKVRRSSWLLWYLAAPLAIPMTGYFPGKRLNMIGDMPGAAMRQWSRWCRSKNYLFDHLSEQQQQRYQHFEKPIHAFHISDDELLQRANIEQLLAHYPSSPTKLIELSPQHANTDRIGHFNVFRSEFKHSLWQQHLLPVIEQSLQP